MAIKQAIRTALDLSIKLEKETSMRWRHKNTKRMPKTKKEPKREQPKLDMSKVMSFMRDK